MKKLNLQQKRNKQLKKKAKQEEASKKEISQINLNASTPRLSISESSFFFRSSLTDERKRQIIEFFNSLTPDQQRMMNEYREDGMAAQDFDSSDSNW